MVRSREYLIKFFSDEIIDREIDRVKRAKVGESLFAMEGWEVDDWVVSILALADVSYETKKVNGMIHYFKANKN